MADAAYPWEEHPKCPGPATGGDTPVTRVAACQLEGRPLTVAAEALDACRHLVAAAAESGADVAVLPEGAYPAYVLGSVDAARRVLAAGPDPLAVFSDLAAHHTLVLVVGLVLDTPRGLENAAVTFGPDGSVLARTAKRFLWHFDREWFVPGHHSEVVDTPVGSVGALVCADARLPEIARTLTVAGAALVCEPTAWVTSTPRQPMNIQPEFLVAARCIENGVAMACASKAGFEGDTVAYVGRSMIVGPDGGVLAEAPERGDTVVTADVDLRDLPSPPVPRRPELYEGLVRPVEGRLASRRRARLGAWNGRGAVTTELLGRARAEGAELVVLAPSSRQDLVSMATDTGMWLVGDIDGAGVVVAPDQGVVARFPEVHRSDGEREMSTAPVVTPVGRVVVLVGDDVLVPEHARIACLDGTEILACLTRGAPEVVLRARAAENRVFVVAAGEPTMVVEPSGAVIADAPTDRGFVCAVDCSIGETALKEMAPGSDVFTGRDPETYRSLVGPSPALQDPHDPPLPWEP